MEGETGLPDVPGLSIDRVVGRGASATVYEATQTRFGRSVALKVLGSSDQDESSRRLFATECRTLGRLSSHPDIVTVFDGGFTADGRPYLVMEYLSGGTLAERLVADGPLDVETALSTGIRLAGALASAHEQGIVHGDVKPQNILTSSAGLPSLADFGIARLLEGSAATSGVKALTPLHAAPELFDGAKPTVLTDVYGLASTLFELLDGRPASGDPGDSPLSVVARVVRRDRRRLEREDVPPELVAAIEAGMAYEPQDRPQSMVAFGELLLRIQSQCGFAPTPMTISEPAPDGPLDSFGEQEGSAATTVPPVDPARGTRRNVALALGAVVVLLAGAGLWFVLAGGTDEASEARSTRTTTTTTTSVPVSVPGASQFIDVQTSVPGKEDLRPWLDAALTDLEAALAPFGAVASSVPSADVPAFPTPANLRYVAVNPAKETGCAGFTTGPVTVNGLLGRQMNLADGSRAVLTVMIFESQKQAKEAFLAFSLGGRPLAQDCTGFAPSFGLSDPKKAEIVHRDPPLTLTPADLRYNSFKLGPPDGRPDLTSVVATVAQQGRTVIILAVGTPSTSGATDPAKVSQAVSNVMARVKR